MGRSVFLVLVIVLTAARSLYAQDLKEGLAAYKRGDYATAIEQWRPLAENGHSGAQYNLGFNYVQGKGVEKDLVAAYFWFDLAARQGKRIAQRLRDGVAASMTEAQIAEAERRVRTWLASRTRPR